MYGQEYIKRVSAVVASAASYSSYVNIAGANRVAIEVPAFATLLGSNAASVRADVCDTATGTYRELYAMGVYSAASGVAQWETLQASGPFVANCEPAAGHKFMRVHLSTAATDGITVYVHLIK